MRRSLPTTDKEQTPEQLIFFSLGRWPIHQSGTLWYSFRFYLLLFDFSLSGATVSSNLGEHFWFSNIGISIQPYQHSEVLYLSLERLKLSLLLSLLVSVRGERLIWHLCPREGWETLNLDLSSHLVFLRVRSNVEILNTEEGRPAILAAMQLFSRPSKQRGPRNTSTVLHSSEQLQLIP